MASIFTPTNWPNVLGPYAIDINDCIGDSVGIINANTNYLASFTTAVSSQLRSRIDTAQGFLKNKLINAQGLINQRVYVSGTATPFANYYTLDRWKVVNLGQNLTFTTAQNVTTFTAPAGGVEQVIEEVNIESGTYVLYWDGTATATVNGTARLKGETFSLTGGTQCTVRFLAGTFSLPQLEKRDTPTSFEYRLFGTELNLCQRYFCKTYDLVTTPGTISSDGAIWTHTDEPIGPGIHNIGWDFPVNMRVKPSCRAYSPVTGTIDRVNIPGEGDKVVDSIVNGYNRISYVELVTSLSTLMRQITVHYTANAEI